MPQDQTTPPIAGRRGLERGFPTLVLITASIVLGLAAWRTGRVVNGNFLILALRDLFSLGAPERFPREALSGLMGGLVVLLTQTGLGYLLLTRTASWRRALPGLGERLALAPLVGALPLALLVLGAGLSGLASPRAVMLLDAVALLGGGLPGLLALFRDYRAWRRGRRAAPVSSPGRGLLVAALAFLLTLMLIYTLAPASESDELRYHLSAPAIWLRDGRIHYLPHQAFSNFPFLAEMLFMAAMAAGGPPAAKLIHFGMLPVIMGLIALWTLALLRLHRGHRRPAGAIPGGTAALAAAAAFATIPMVAILSAWGFIDLFVTANVLAFGYVALVSLRAPCRATPGLLGWLGAVGLGIKYTMLPLMAACGVVWFGLLFLRTRSWLGALRAALVCALVAALFGSPWYVKNLAWTGNPVYPLAYSIFDGRDWSQENAALYLAKAQSKGMPQTAPPGAIGRMLDFLATPWNTLFHPDWYEDHFLGPLPLMATILLVGRMLLRGSMRLLSPRPIALGPRRRRVALLRAWLAALVLLTWVLWFLSYQSNRFLMPTVALILAAAAAAAARWESRLGGVARFLMRSAFVLALIYALAADLVFLMEPFKAVGARREAFAVAVGCEDPDFYLVRRLNYYRGAMWLNENSLPGEGALLIGEHRTLYFELPLVASDWYDTPQPLPLIRATPDNDALLDRLLASGVRYVLYNADELGRYREGFFRPRFLPEEYRRFEALWSNPRLQSLERFFRPGVEDTRIYRILPSPSAVSEDAPMPHPSP